MEVSRTLHGGELIAHDFSVMRSQRFLYAHKIGDTLAAELNEYHARNDDVMNLASEMALLRMQVGESLNKYEAWRNFKPTEEQLKQWPQATIDMMIVAAQLEMNAAIARVQDMAVSMAKIQAARNGKIDQIYLQAIASNVAQQLDYAIQEFTHADSTNDRAVLLANRVDGLLTNAFAAIGNSNGSGNNSSGANSIAGGVNKQPTRQTAEEILLAMAATVPFVNDAANESSDDTDLESLDSIDEPTDLVASIVPIKHVS